MVKKLLVFSLLFFVSLMFVSTASAHGDDEKEAIYEMTLSQVPPAPIFGQEANITLSIKDKNGVSAKNLIGVISVKQLKVKQYVGVDPKVEEVEVFREKKVADENGEVTLPYTFTSDSEYDVEFAWGDNEEQSVGEIIKPVGVTGQQVVRNPMQDILVYSIIGIGGAVVGAFATFILLTTSLRPKK